jgi:hypothetical protein
LTNLVTHPCPNFIGEKALYASCDAASGDFRSPFNGSGKNRVSRLPMLHVFGEVFLYKDALKKTETMNATDSHQCRISRTSIFLLKPSSSSVAIAL